MSTQSIVADGLWKCLCPSYKAGLGVIPRTIARTSRHGGRQLRFSSLHSAPPLRPQRHDQTPFATIYTKFARRPLSYDTNVARGSTKHNDLSFLYEQLRPLASVGDVGEVKQIITRLLQVYHEKPNLAMYSALILAQTGHNNGSARRVASLLAELREEGLEPDARLCLDTLKALAIHPDYVLRNEILEFMRERWFTVTAEGHHYIAAGYIKERAYELVLEKIYWMVKEGMTVQPWLYDMAFLALIEEDEVQEAYRIAQLRSEVSKEVPKIIWLLLLDKASRLLNHEITTIVWRQQVERGYLIPSSGTCMDILHTSARKGDVHLATDVFRVLERRKTVFNAQHYELLLEAYLTLQDLKTAISVYPVMVDAGIKMDQGSTRLLYKYLTADPRRPEEAFRHLESLLEMQAKVPIQVTNCVMDASIELDNLTLAVGEYKTIGDICESGPDVETFNVLLRGCTNERRKELGIYLVSEMLGMNISPNTLTYERLIMLCLAAGDTEDAYKYYEEMDGLGWRPRPEALASLKEAMLKSGDDRASSIEHLEILGRFEDKRVLSA